MNLANRQFRNNLTGETVKVIDSFENIAILDNRTKSNPAVLLNPNLYTEVYETVNESASFRNEEEVNVNSFFENQNAYNSLADRIKNIPPDQMGNDMGGQVHVNMSGVSNTPVSNFNPISDENIVYETTEESEKDALARKYGIVAPDVNSMNKQNEAFAQLLGEDAELPEVPQIFPQTITQDQEVIQRIEVRRDEYQAPTPVHIPQVEDPIIRMFKGVKRNVNFNVSIDLSDKIPRVDFIEMMEDSYETSIIDFLANEFTEKILNDPEMIRTVIKEKIKKMVYSSEWSSSDMDKLKAPAIKGTFNVQKQVALDIEENAENIDVEKPLEAEVPKEKKKRTYRKKNEVAND